MARRRRRWRSWQAGLDPQRLVFIDETWIKTNMAPLRGWAPKGDRLRGFAPHGHWRTMTFLGALRYDRLAAPCLFDGPTNGECFRAYVEQILVPSLRPGNENPAGPGFHGRTDYLGSWCPAYRDRSAIRITGSPFKAFDEAEAACDAMLKHLTSD